MNTAIYDLLETAEFVVDADGHKKAVMLNFDVWEDLLNLLEDIDDSAEIEMMRNSDEHPIAWETAKAQLRAEGIDV